MENEGISDISVDTPLYVEAYTKLFEMIKSSEVGEKLPSEENLAKQFNISRNTLRQALQILQEDKVIYKKRGSGTYISHKAPLMNKSSFIDYCTTEEFLQKQGLEVELKSMEITFEDSDEITSKQLEIVLHTPVFVFNRTFCKKGEQDMIYAQQLDFLPHYIFSGIEMDKSIVRRDFIAIAQAQGKFSQTEIIATLAGKVFSSSMLVDEDTPLLLVQQIILDAQGNKLYLNKTYLNSQATDISVLINRN